ncbi:hypothetical protein HNY73_019443 [Argiope bruennichi]|uniref:Uncharacterized protein n=1 Tax=Argiope bruennichi TaxID=94029 RepID=A0A8T0E4Q9_ARGBR|nr:hypothetical protein HNY73_019443 [Argiope bruennichi]
MEGDRRSEGPFSNPADLYLKTLQQIHENPNGLFQHNPPPDKNPTNWEDRNQETTLETPNNPLFEKFANSCNSSTAHSDGRVTPTPSVEELPHEKNR